MRISAIQAEDLKKTYTTTRGVFRREHVERAALQGVDLDIARGELFGLLSPNGAGKTTIVKIFTTLLLPTSGAARILGLDVVKDPWAIRKRIGFVFGGERGLYWRLSGLDNLRYFADQAVATVAQIVVQRASARSHTRQTKVVQRGASSP